MKVKNLHEANELQNRSKKHKKRNKGLSPYCSLNPDAGNVENNVSMFNKMNSSEGGPSVNPCGPMAEDLNDTKVSHLFKLHVGDSVEYEGKTVTVDDIQNDSEHTELVPSMLKLGDEWVPEEEVVLNTSEELREEKRVDFVELHYDNLEVTVTVRPRRPASYDFDYDRDEAQTAEETVEYDYSVPKNDVVEFLLDQITENDLENLETASDEEIVSFVNDNFDSLFNKYESMILDHFMDDARETAEDDMYEASSISWLSESCGMEKFLYRLGNNLHETYLLKNENKNTASELSRLKNLYEKYSAANDKVHTKKIVEKIDTALKSCSDNTDMYLKESTDEYVIMAVPKTGRKQYYNVSSVPHWVDNAKDATIFDDRDEARSIWLKIDKKPFKNVFIPNYDSKLMNEVVDTEAQCMKDGLQDRIDDLLDFTLKQYPSRPVGNGVYRVGNRRSNMYVTVKFDLNDFSSKYVFTVDGKKYTANTETEAARIIKTEVDTKYAKSFDVAVESLSDRIRKNDLEYDDEIDAWYADEDNVSIQFQDRQTNTHEMSTAKDKWGNSYISGKKNRQPRVSSNTWGRVWKDDKLVKQFQGPKYKVRSDMAKYLDDEENDTESNMKNEGIFDSKEKKARNYADLIKKVFGEDINRVVSSVVSSASELIQEVADTIGEDGGGKNLANSIIKIIKNAKATINKTPHSLVKNIASIGQKYQRESVNLEELKEFLSKVGKLQNAGKDGYKAMQFLFNKVNTVLSNRLDSTMNSLVREYGLVKECIVNGKDKISPRAVESIIDTNGPKKDRRLSFTSQRYKGYRISMDRAGDGYNVYDPHGELEDAGFSSVDQAREFIDSLNSEVESLQSMDLDESNYGGAYDIDPEQYFTRDDLMDFAEEVISCIASREDVLFDICELYIDGNSITLGLTNSENGGDFEHYVTFKVDMRKIRYPHDLSKYVTNVANEFIKEYKDQCAAELGESVEDTAFEWEYRTSNGRWIIRQAGKDYKTPMKLTRDQAQKIADFRGYKDGELVPLKESTDNEYMYKGYNIVFAKNGECSVIDRNGKHLGGNLADAEARELIDSLTESFLDERNVKYPNGQPVTDIDLEDALDYMYGTDRNPEWTYTDAEMQKAVNTWMDKVDPHPDGSYNDLTEDRK